MDYDDIDYDEGYSMRDIDNNWFNDNMDYEINFDSNNVFMTNRIAVSKKLSYDSEPLAIIYRIYYKLMKTTLDPQSMVEASPKGHTLLLQASTSNSRLRVPK